MKVKSSLIVFALLFTCLYSTEALQSDNFSFRHAKNLPENSFFLPIQVNGVVTGTVKNIGGGAVGAGVKVECNSGTHTFTNSAGQYSLTLPVGTWVLKAIGPCMSAATAVQIQAGETTVRDIMIPCETLQQESKK